MHKKIGLRNKFIEYEKSREGGNIGLLTSLVLKVFSLLNRYGLFSMCKINWYPKFYCNTFTFVTLKTLETFIEFLLVCSNQQCSSFTANNFNKMVNFWFLTIGDVHQFIAHCPNPSKYISLVYKATRFRPSGDDYIVDTLLKLYLVALGI